MTQEEKAKAYDEAYKRATIRFGSNVADELFPELKESEDEKVRKALIEMVHDTTGDSLWIDYNVHKSEAIDWLEKQGKQKPTNKVEPKFKVGDWIVSNEKLYVYQIEEINDFVAKVNENGVSFVVDVKCLNDAHLWTIQDAKDGDVLASKDKLNILIFRNLDTSTSFSSYYNIAGKGEFGWSNDCFTPATKEQCDQLEKAMTDAGYTFNFEKKELKKIEQKPTELAKGEDYGIDGLYHAQRILEKTFGKVDGYQTDDGILSHECAISAVKELYEQKPAWSEEDESIVLGIEQLCNCASLLNIAPDKIDKIRTWLKSLKERMKGE